MEAVKDCKCGQKPIAFGTNYYFFLYCQNCFEHSEVKDNPAEAITAWNRRVTQNIGKEGGIGMTSEDLMLVSIVFILFCFMAFVIWIKER